jgi:hypothetical protein
MKVNQCFGKTYRLHLQCKRVSQTRNHGEVGDSFTLVSGLFFDSEDGGDMLLRIVC